MFTRRDVLQAFAEHTRNGATVASIESSADAFLSRDGIVELEPLAGDRRYSTRELLQLEHGAIERAQRQRPNAAVATERAVGRALAGRPSITAEQRELVAAATRSKRGVVVVRARRSRSTRHARPGSQAACRCSVARFPRRPRASCATRRPSTRPRSPG